jgi:hypothetical protein
MIFPPDGTQVVLAQIRMQLGLDRADNPVATPEMLRRGVPLEN